MDQLGLYNLVQDIFSQKSPEAIADETRHGNRSTFVRLPVGTLTKTGLRLDGVVTGSVETPLLDIIAPTFIEDEINEQSLKCLIKKMKKMIATEIRKCQQSTRGYRDSVKKYAQAFELLCREYSDTDISRKLDVSRQRVRQIKEKLRTLKCVKKFYKELKGDYRGLKW